LENLKRAQQPADYYVRRLSGFAVIIHNAKKKLQGLAFLRLFVFLATLVMVVMATRWGWPVLVTVAISGLLIFLLIVIRYHSLQRKLRYDESLADINENELKSLRGNYSMFDHGEEFNDPEHPFAADLDIFGPQGIYQYLNRSATSLGRQHLATWLAKPLTDGIVITARQEAVAELSAKPGFRQEFLATGYLVKEQPSDKNDLLSWIREPAGFASPKFRFYLIFIPVVTFAVLALAIFSVISPTWVLLYLAVPFGLTGIHLKKISKKYQVLSGKAELMKKYSGLFLKIERERFVSGKMNSLKEALHGTERLPSEATRDLSAVLDAFDARNNILAGFFLNFLLLWDIRQVVRTERWQERYRDELPRWLEVLAETDALCSLANFHFNHPASIFPEVGRGGAILDARALGHPLIMEKNRVDNPAAIPSLKHFTIVTGANMAGKSTYLRAVGVNLVLAMAGSAVIAEEMTFQPAGLVTSIRTKDSLQKNESYFYAELKRLKNIMDRLQQGETLIILLDEILKGTNSRDKQSGSIALVEKLLRYEAAGLIATHDLALGELEKTHPGSISNKSFEVVIENDALMFDYKLKDGIARQMNATFLMRKMGITD
jgi:hypothetical protein